MGIKRGRDGEDLPTAITLNSSSSSSSSKFGSFILHAAVDFENFREDAVFTLSSVSESESAGYGSWFSESFGLWSTGFNGICGECDSGSGSGWRWSTNDSDGLRCCVCRKGNNISGGELSNDDQQQQQLVLKLGNLGFPSCYSFGKPPPKVMVVGSCNGLICLYDEQSNDVSLWNPATSQFRILPKSLPITIAAAAGDDGNVHRLFAFGFDDETKDYKVVLLSVSNRRMLDFVIKDEPAAPMECVCQVEVYSSSTNSWNVLERITSLPGFPFPYPPDSSSELFYLNGSSCCFFMANLLYSSEEEEEQCIPPPKLSDRFIISLDLTKEIITPIQLPSHHYREKLYLCYLGKKIALFAKLYVYKEVYDVNDPPTTGSWENFYIWVFNEHRSSSSSSVDDASWTRVHNFRIILGLPGELNIPRGISNDAVFALLETEICGGLGSSKKKKALKLYNLITKELKENFLSCDQVLSKAFPYEPSQVWIEAAADMVIGKDAECSSQRMIID